MTAGTKCEQCGEMIRCPTDRLTRELLDRLDARDTPPQYVCSDCYDTKGNTVGCGRAEYGGGVADRQYHGGQFHSGEW